MYYDSKTVYEGVECLPTNYLREVTFNIKDQYIPVNTRYENRLDLVAYDYYNNVNLWWFIALASDIRNPLDVPEGTTLRIPPLTTLYTYQGGVNIGKE